MLPHRTRDKQSYFNLSNSYEALNDDFPWKSNGDEALNDDFP